MIKVGIIGIGRIFDKHFNSLNQNKNYKIIAVCDTDIKKSNKNNIKGIKFYKNYETMVKTNIFDLIVICTPSGKHAKQAIYISKFVKNIVIEKPISISLKEALKLEKIEKQKKCNFFVVKQNRLNKPILFLKKAIEKKLLGKINYLTVRVRWSRNLSYFKQAPWRGKWKSDGGVLGNQASHYLDLITWLINDDFEYVQAFSLKSIKEIQAHDTVIANIKFKNGILVNLETTTSAKPENIEGSVSIFGSHGNVIISGKSANQIENYFSSKRKILNLKKFSEYPKNIYGFGHMRFYSLIYNQIKNLSKRNEFSVSSSIKSVKLMHAIYKSSFLKKTIKIKKNIFFDKFEK